MAQPTGLRVTDVSAQQAIIEYTAPNSEACSLVLADRGSWPVTVWDTSAVFSGSTTDLLRLDTQTWDGGRARKIILGHRVTEQGNDGKLYSRSLQANTPHELTVTCGSPAKVAFKTRNIPVGNMAPDPPDYHAAGFGNAAWPSIDWSDRNRVYIDHKTGVALRGLTLPGDLTMVTAGVAFNTQYDASGAWVNVSDILSPTGSSSATSSGTSPIFVGITQLPQLGVGNKGSNWQGTSIVGLRLRVMGYGTDSNPVNRQVSACITVDSGQTCVSQVQVLTLNRNSAALVCHPTCADALSAPFTGWGMGTFPAHNLVSPYSATVNTNGVDVIATTPVEEGTLGGGLFPTNLAPNSRVLINGTQYAVSSVESALHLSLQASAGTQSGVDLKANNFGLKLWKTTAVGEVSLSTTYDVLYSTVPGFLIEDGSSDQCSPVEATYTRNAAGATVPGYKGRLCLIQQPMGSLMYLIRSDTGESWPVGVVFNTYGEGFGNQTNPQLGYSPWDKTAPGVLYGRAFQQDTSVPLLAKWTYRGDGRQYSPGPLPDSGVWSTLPNGQKASGTNCNSSEQTAGNLCAAVVTSSPPSVQLAAQSTQFSNNAFGNVLSVIGNIGPYTAIKFGLSQDAVQMVAYVNRSTGIVEQWSDTMWSRPGGRFGALHTALPIFPGDRYNLIAVNPLGSRGNSGPFAGPYESHVTAVCRGVDGTGNCTSWDSANTAVSSTFSVVCPASACGTTINNALLLKIAGQPCSAFANADEKAHYPCPWNPDRGMLSALQVGDLIGDRAQCAAACSELLRIKQLVIHSTTDISLWVERNATAIGQAQSNFANGFNVMPFPSSSCTSANWYFDSTNGSAPVLAEDCLVTSHVDGGPGPTPGHYTYASAISGKFDQPASPMGFAAGVLRYGGFGEWQGLTAGSNWLGNGQVEFYQSLRQISAPPTELVWSADWRAYQGGNATSGGSGTRNRGVTIVPITAADSSTVYKISSGLTWPYKVLPGEGWAGRFILRDISPANITTSTPYAYCVALKPGECAPASNVNDVVFYVPGGVPSSTCFTNQMEVAIPCIVPSSPIGNWAVQQDLSKGSTTGYSGYFRRLTMGLSGPSRQYTFTNWRPTPDAKYGMMLSAFADGVYPLMLLAKIPEWPGYDSVRRDSLIGRQVVLGPGAALAEIRFGYEENGPRPSFQCTKRNDVCATRVAPTNTEPFQFLSVDGHSGIACADSCTISIPTIPGRIVWWQEFRSGDGGATWQAVGSISPMMGN